MATIINKKTNVPGQAQEQAQKTPMLGGGGQSASAPASAGTQGPQQKSGGFTNLSSYLSANRDAGSKIAGEIGKGVQKDVGQKKDIAAKETGEFKSSIESAQKNIQQGEEFLKQLTPTQQAQAAQQPQQPQETGGKYVPPAPAPEQKITPNLQDVSTITNDPNLLNKFTGMRTGETFGADKAAMYGDTGNAGEYGQAFGATQDLAKTYGSRIGQVQGEGSGRFQLLKEFLATPKQQYGKGLSSLDNALLQTDKTKSLQNLSQNLQKQSVADVAGQTKELEQQNLQAKAAVAKGQELGGGGKEPGKIQAKANEIMSEADKAMKDPAYVKQLNAQRAAKQEWAKTQMERLKSGQSIDPEFAQMMGIKGGERLGHTLVDKDISNYMNFGAAELSSGLQAMTPEQQARMSSIYQLAGQQFTTPEQAAAAVSEANKYAEVLKLAEDELLTGGGSRGTWRTTSKKTADRLSDYNIDDEMAKSLTALDTSDAGIKASLPNLLQNQNLNRLIRDIGAEQLTQAGTGDAMFTQTGMDVRSIRSLIQGINSLKEQGYFNKAIIEGQNTKVTPKV